MGESAENYLETILILSQRKGNVRAIDVATEMDFSKPSVSVALKHLREQGLLTADKDGCLTLTPEGRRAAESVYERHRVLSECFIMLGVDEKTAQQDACKTEHVVSKQTFDAIKKHFESFRNARR